MSIDSFNAKRFVVRPAPGEGRLYFEIYKDETGDNPDLSIDLTYSQVAKIHALLEHCIIEYVKSMALQQLLKPQ